MLSLNVQRQNAAPLDSKDASTVIFYDESIFINLESSKVCGVHLYVTVLGNLHDREREHSIVICDEDLPKGKTWSSKIHVRHPRSPLQNPHMEIVATAHYTAEDDEQEDIYVHNPSIKSLTPFSPLSLTKSSFLVPFEKAPVEFPDESRHGNNKGSNHSRAISNATSINFAETFDERRYNAHHEPTITGLTVTKKLGSKSKSETEPQTKDIEIVRWNAPLMQALELEIRSLRPALERDRIIAEVDLVAGKYEVCVTACSVELEEGVSKLMGTNNLPIKLRMFEKYAMCYNLQLRAATQMLVVPASRKPLNLALECEILLEPFGDGANPRVTTAWMPLVDFEGTQGPLPKTPALNLPMNSPLMPSFSSSNAQMSGGSSTTLDLVSGPRQNSTSNLSLMGGISIVIIGPQFVRLGETFEWDFKVLNRSQRNRLFTINFGSFNRDITKKDIPASADPLTSLSTYNGELLRRRAASNFRNNGGNRGIIPLCQELRVGPLAPYVCFETKLKLISLDKGTHTIETARIEDLNSRDSYDVGNLLEVIVLSNEDQ